MHPPNDAAHHPEGGEPKRKAGRTSNRRTSVSAPEPWHEPVDGQALLHELATMFERFLVLPSGAAPVLAGWVLHTYVFRSHSVTPRLAVTSPLPECGKTVLLSLVGSLSAPSVQAENVSAASVFRLIDSEGATLVIDEADTFLRDNPYLRGVLNAGHRSDGAVLRCVGKDHESHRFSVFAPVAIGMIGSLPASLISRSIHITMHRRKSGESVERLDLHALREDLVRLRRQAARWAADNIQRLTTSDPKMPPGIDNRAADNWRVLVAIADAVGGKWREGMRRLARRFSGPSATHDQDASVLLLSDVRDVFDEAGVNRLTSKAIAEHLAGLEDRPWPEFRDDNPITPPQVAAVLKPFGITPRTIRTPEGTAKGYMRESFEDAFERYVP